jgi:hypothetical protein
MADAKEDAEALMNAVLREPFAEKLDHKIFKLPGR